jgi:hypothetical protein
MVLDRSVSHWTNSALCGWSPCPHWDSVLNLILSYFRSVQVYTDDLVEGKPCPGRFLCTCFLHASVHILLRVQESSLDLSRISGRTLVRDIAPGRPGSHHFPGIGDMFFAISCQQIALVV